MVGVEDGEGRLDPSTLNYVDVSSLMVEVEEGEGRKNLAFGSLGTTCLAERINKLESQMLDWKVVLLDDEGKPLPLQKEATDNVGNNSKEANHVFDDSFSDEVEDVYNETGHSWLV